MAKNVSKNIDDNNIKYSEYIDKNIEKINEYSEYIAKNLEKINSYFVTSGSSKILGPPGIHGSSGILGPPGIHGSSSSSSSGGYSTYGWLNSYGSSGINLIKIDKSVKSTHQIEEQGIIKKIFKLILSIFIKKENDNQYQLSGLNTSSKLTDEQRYIDDSKLRISKLKSLNENIKSDIINDIIDNLEILQDLMINGKFKIISLEKFHIYYTDNFISYFEKLVQNEIIERDKKILINKKELKDLKIEYENKNKKIESINRIKLDIMKYENYLVENILKNIDLSFIEKN